MFKIESENGKIFVTSPYSSEFINGCRRLNGKWDKERKVWVFDCRLESEVSDYMLDVFGTDSDNYEKVDVIVDLTNYQENNYFTFAGIRRLYREYRDYDVKITGCSVISGGFKDRGGSRNNPALAPLDGTKIKIFDVPKDFALKRLNEHNDIEIIEHNNAEEKVETNPLINFTTEELIKELRRREIAC